MKDFFAISLLSIFLLLWSPPSAKSKQLVKKELPQFIARHKNSFKASFQAAENGHVAWAFLTSEKNGITPKTKKDFQILQLAFLFSPSGLHLSALFLLIGFFIKKILRQKFSQKIRFCFLFLFYFLPFLAIKRIILLRLFLMIRNHFKIKIPLESLFFLTFIIAFLLGHFKQSPQGFIYSFLFMGTFISLRDHSRLFILLAIWASHQLICLFTAGAISPLAFFLNIPLLGFFSFLFTATITHLMSYQFIPFNWPEPFIRLFIVSIHYGAKLIKGSELEASLGLLLASWMILLRQPKRYLALFLFLHIASAKAPTFIQTGHF